MDGLGFGLMGEGGQYGGPVALARSRDPRFAYAQALANSALEPSTPIYHPAQGFGQLAKAAVSAFAMKKLEDEYQNRDADYARSIANALQAGQGTPAETRTYSTPDDNGNPTQINWNAVAPDPNRMTNILAQNRDTAPMALNMGMQQIAAQQALQNHLSLARGMIPIEADKARTLMPINIEQASGIAGGQAAATTPFDINRAVQIAAQTAPYTISTAGGVAKAQAEATAPFVGPNAQAAATGQLAAHNAPVQVQLPGQAGPVSLPAASVAPAAAKVVEQAGQQGQQNTNTEEKMADDFRQEPAVVAYKKVLPTFNSMAEAAKSNTRAADLNLVYGLATIFDPGSAVREGEQVLVQNTAALPDWLVGQINRLNGGAGLQPDTRNAIMEQAASRVQNYKAQFDQTAAQYQDTALRRGLNHKNIIVAPSDMTPFTPIKNAAPSSIPDGATATGPDGVRVIKRNGAWVPLQ